MIKPLSLMCVQLAGTEDMDAVALRFAARRSIRDAAAHRAPHATVRPTDRTMALIATPTERRLGWMWWGWREMLTRTATSTAKTPKPTLLLHARFETALYKPMWAEAFARRRCAIVTSGWWEVQAQPGRARGIPYFYSAPTAPLLALAALWRREGDDIRFTMLTTAPTPQLEPIHDRLPVVLDDAALTQWLDPSSALHQLGELGKVPGHAVTAWQSTALGEQTAVC